MISRKRLRDFTTLHPGADRPLTAGYRVMSRMTFASFAELRLVAAIHYDRQRVSVRHVLTHADYDRGNWLDD